MQLPDEEARDAVPEATESGDADGQEPPCDLTLLTLSSLNFNCK